MQLQELKDYLREDTEDEDKTIKSFQTAAEEYLTNAGVVKDYNKSLYKLAIKMLVSHWHENRRIVIIGSTTKTSKEIEMTLSPIVSQLKYTQESTV